MTFPNITDLIGNVVAACRDTGSDAPYYEYGHATEIVNTLMEKDQLDIWKLKKYPAIFLILKPEMEEDRDKYTSEVEVDIVIVTDTRPEWKAKERDLNVFNPILIPLYDRFILELGRTQGIIFGTGKHKYVKHYFWGSTQTGANVANDYADAIEVKKLNFKTFPTCSVYSSGSKPTFDSTYIKMDSIAYEFSNQ